MAGKDFFVRIASLKGLLLLIKRIDWLVRFYLWTLSVSELLGSIIANLALWTALDVWLLRYDFTVSVSAVLWVFFDIVWGHIRVRG